ncbi:MAG TPA: c-type cytochrome [Terriglobales bacterium]|jgi:mono/diheme cytochrome c family protein|nr:c-type cytochrome [Terriglobales bacterium]
MESRKLLGCAIVLAAALVAGAQEQSQKVVKHVPIKPTSAASGEEMYNTYCAVCHAKDGKGNGPAAEALKVPPPDLTQLSKKNGGNYPSLKVSAIIRGEQSLPAHGTKDMPVWGALFWKMSQGHESEVQQRIANLNKHIEGMQQK